MAHIEKYQAAALGNMLGHYARRAELEHGYERENIDPRRTGLNYNLCERLDPLGFIEDRIGELDLKRKPRKDAVKMVDTVVTLPQSYVGDIRAFMGAVKGTLDGIFGAENCVGAWVHMDETTPHMHYASVPVTEDGRLSAKSLLNRTFMKQFHDRLEQGVCERLGIERAGLTLTDEERQQRAGRYVSLPEYKAAQEAARAAQELGAALDTEVEDKQQRLERLRQRESEQAAAIAELDREIEQAELQPAQESVSESLRALWTARGDGEREEVLGSEIEGLRSRISGLERANQSARERVGDLDRRLPLLRERHRVLGRRFEDLTERVTAVIDRLRAVPETLSRWALDIADELGIRTYDPRSLAWQAEQARAVASRAASEHIPGRDVTHRGWSR